MILVCLCEYELSGVSQINEWFATSLGSLSNWIIAVLPMPVKWPLIVVTARVTVVTDTVAINFVENLIG